MALRACRACWRARGLLRPSLLERADELRDLRGGRRRDDAEEVTHQVLHEDPHVTPELGEVGLAHAGDRPLIGFEKANLPKGFRAHGGNRSAMRMPSRGGTSL